MTPSITVDTAIVHIEIQPGLTARPGALAQAELQARRQTAKVKGVPLHEVSPARLLPEMVKGRGGLLVYSYECSVTVSPGRP